MERQKENKECLRKWNSISLFNMHEGFFLSLRIFIIEEIISFLFSGMFDMYAVYAYELLCVCVCVYGWRRKQKNFIKSFIAYIFVS